MAAVEQLYERQIGGADLPVEARSMSTHSGAQETAEPVKDPRLETADDLAIAALLKNFDRLGVLRKHILTVQRAAVMFEVPFPTVNSWTRNPKSPNYLPTLDGITEKERLVLLSDFLDCLGRWKPRRAAVKAEEPVAEPVAEVLTLPTKRSRRKAEIVAAQA